MIDRTSVLCSGRAASGAPGAVFGDGPRNHGPTQPGPADVDGPLRVSAGCTLPAVPVSWSPGHRSLDRPRSPHSTPRCWAFPWHLRGTLATYCATVEIPAKQVVKARIAKQLRDVLEA